MNEILANLRGGLIVSCQSEGCDPFNADPKYMALFAKAAEMGGAKGIRSQGINKIKEIKKVVSLPIIGLLKSTFKDGTVKITSSFNEVEQLIEIGCDIIAIDGTQREREGLTGPCFIHEVKQRYNCIVLADIATCEEAVACEKAGADAVSTTLNGYTPETMPYNEKPNLDLLRSICEKIEIPVFAEGRYNTPADAIEAAEIGAHAIVTGTAITRPRVVTQWFVNKLKEHYHE